MFESSRQHRRAWLSASGMLAVLMLGGGCMRDPNAAGATAPAVGNSAAGSAARRNLPAAALDLGVPYPAEPQG
ncbi:MAG TPA: hypothetical protein VFQ61_28635, partial [Polyangiaceae bacterium]|nr:hypothetical protein [Polyangiaceae bacterium]